jgi:hypothetical protein
MMKVRTVLLYGNSLVISSIGATLDGQPGLHLLRMAAGPQDLASRLPTPPDIVIFDLVATPLDIVLPLVQGQPAPLLVGLDMASDRTLVVSGGQRSVHSQKDLLRLIGDGCGGNRRGDGDAERWKRGDAGTLGRMGEQTH